MPLAQAHRAYGSVPIDRLRASTEDRAAEIIRAVQRDVLDTTWVPASRLIQPKSGLGQAFQDSRRCSDLDGEAQFTIDGRTATMKGRPRNGGWAFAAIYNAPTTAVEWRHQNVRRYAAVRCFDLRAARRAALDP